MRSRGRGGVAGTTGSETTASRAVGAAGPSADVSHAEQWAGSARKAPIQCANHSGRATSFSQSTCQDQSATVIGTHLKEVSPHHSVDCIDCRPTSPRVVRFPPAALLLCSTLPPPLPPPIPSPPPPPPPPPLPLLRFLFLPLLSVPTLPRPSSISPALWLGAGNSTSGHRTGQLRMHRE